MKKNNDNFMLNFYSESFPEFLTHLNVQTNSNISFSLITIKELVSWALKNKLLSLSIADYFPFDINKFFSLCRENGIRAIWGVKVFVFIDEEKIGITIYPKNNIGYKECIKTLFNSDSPIDRIFSFERIFLLLKNCFFVFEVNKEEDIKKLWFWSCNKFDTIIVNEKIFFGINFLIFEKNLSEEIKVKLLPFLSIKFFDLNNEKEKKTLSLLAKTSFSKHFFNEDKEKFFHYLGVNKTLNLCSDNALFSSFLFDQWKKFLLSINLDLKSFFEKKKNSSNDSKYLELKETCFKKLDELNIEDREKENYVSSLEKELDLIKKMEYCDYFLNCAQIMKTIKDNNIITGFGRGSSVSSLTCFLLGITQIDPLKHNLIFERFINEYRKDFPDIDMDIEDQEAVFNLFLKKKEDRVDKGFYRMVIKKKIDFRSALVEAISVFGLNEEKYKGLLSHLKEKSKFHKASEEEEKNFLYLELNVLRKCSPNLFFFVEKVTNLFYSFFFHSSGLVMVSDNKKIKNLLPLVFFDKYSAILWGEDDLSGFGIKKYDLLSLKESLGLVNIAKKNSNMELLELSKLDFLDKKTWFFFNNLLLTGLFQLDTISARNIFLKIRPKSFFDLAVFLAFNRPATVRKVSQYIKFREKKSCFYSSELIKSVLSNTFGCVVFEEQITELVSLIYDCSLARAEYMRKNINLLIKDEFLEKALKKGIIKEEAKFLLNEITDTKFTYNKAHAIAYASLTYYCCFIKANYFDELIIHFLNNSTSERKFCYLRESFFCGYKIIAPEINISHNDWIKEQKSIILGFSSLKYYNKDFFYSVCEERKKGRFVDFSSFLDRVVVFWPDMIVYECLESWIKSGLFKSFNQNAEALLSSINGILLFVSLKKTLPKSKSKDLPLPIFYKKTKNIAARVINEWEHKNLGFFFSFFSRWKELSFLKKIGMYINFVTCSDNFLSVLMYAVIIEFNKFDNFFLIRLEDTRSVFDVFINIATYKENEKKIIKYNELLFEIEKSFEMKGNIPKVVKIY